MGSELHGVENRLSKLHWNSVPFVLLSVKLVLTL